MQYYPFDSRNPLYSKSIGALASGETLRLRLLLHNDAHCHNAYVVLQRDGEPPWEVRLEPKEWLEDYRFYDCAVPLGEGLYWYYFRYESDYGEFLVTKTEASLGIVSRDGAKWQKTVYDSDYETPDRLSGGIIYQIFPDSFFSSGSAKKGVPEDRFIKTDILSQPEHRQNNGPCSLGNDYYCGDLKGIEEKLDYIESLGVSIIYLNPVFEAHSNHRYNTADYMKIDPMLGDESDLKSLCAAAEKRGITVILDGVFSHTGDDSVYFNKYRRYGDGGAYNDRSGEYSKWYTFVNYECGYKAWWGVPSLPETNEEDPSFSEFITGENGVLRHWLRLGAGGWRLDVADELPDGFLDKVRSAVKAENREAFILGEVWEDASNKISYGARRRFLRGRQLDSVMNYPFAEAVISFVCKGDSYGLNNTVLDITENYPPQSVRLLMNHIGTHDTARAITAIARYSQYCGDRQWQSEQILSEEEYLRAVVLLKAAAVIQYTLPGLPSLYYGDEAGLSGYGDPFCRAAYPWGKEDKALLEFYKELGAFRRNTEAFKNGGYTPLCCSDGFIVFLRSFGDSAAVTAVNVSNEEKVFSLSDKMSKYSSYLGCRPENGVIALGYGEYCILNIELYS